LVVTIDSTGSLRLGPEGHPVTVERLKEDLTAQVSKNPQLRFAINADKSAPFGQIIKVMDAAKEAGIKAVNAFTRDAAKP
jgi:biopolymer transport protein ExbD